MSEAFISYSRRNKEFVQKLITAFAEQKRDIWVDWEDIPLGSEWWEEIKSGIEKANAFVFVLSLDSVTSQVCGREIEHALQHNKRIIPIICKSDFSNDQVHPKLASINWIFFDPNDFAGSFEKLIATLDSNLDHAKMHTRLLTRALEWEEKKRNNSFLLVGRDLADAETWLASCAGLIPKPTPLHTQYILEGQRMKSVRQKRLTVAAMVVLCITLGLGVFAETQREQAVKDRKIAEEAMIKALQANAEAGILNRDYLTALIDSTIAAEKMQNSQNGLITDIESQRNAKTMRKLIYSINQFNQFESETETMRSANFTPDGKYIISLGAQKTVKIWTQTGEEHKTVSLPEKGQNIAIKGDNSFAVCDKSGRIGFYSAEGALLGEMKNQGVCQNMVFSNDNRWLIFAQEDKKVHVIDVVKQQPLFELSGHTGKINDVAITTDGKWIASAANDNTVKIWDASTQQLVQTLEQHRDRVYSVDFSPDDSQLVTGSADQSIILWDFQADTHQWKQRIQIPAHSNWVLDVVFTPDSKMLASASADHQIKIWNKEGSLLWVLGGHSRAVRSVSFNPEGNILVSAGKDKRVNLYSFSNPMMRILYGFTGSLRDINFSPDGQRLVTLSSGDKPLKIWTNKGVLEKQVDYSGGLRTVDFRDNEVFATASYDKKIILWNIQGNKLFEWENAHDSTVKSLMFSNNKKYLASCSTDHSVKLWDAQLLAQTPIRQFIGHTEEVLDLVFSPDDRYLATVGADKIIKLWDVETGQLLKNLEGHEDWVNSIYYSQDGTRLLSASSDGTVKLWDVQTGQVIQTIEAHPKEWAWDAQFSPKGDLIATAGSDGSAKLWTKDGKLITELSEHSNWVRAVTFSPDGKYLATAGADQKAILWDIEQAQKLNKESGIDTLIAESCKWLTPALISHPELQDRMCQKYLATQNQIKAQ